jgi:endonuclease-3
MIELLDSSDDDEQLAPEPLAPGSEPEAGAADPGNASNRRSSNPFAAFAFEDAGDQQSAPPPPLATKRPAPVPSAVPNTQANKKRARPAAASASASSSTAGKRHECGPPEDFEALRAEEREAVYRKWSRIVDMANGGGHPKLISGDGGVAPAAAAAVDDEETRRFRTLVAVILSSRTQEAMVRQAMQRIAAMPGGFTVETLAAVDPGDTGPLHERIHFVHINKVKSRHIVQSARRVRDELGGVVPRTLEGLLGMAGIGPTLAPLLVFLFEYPERKKEQQRAEKGTQKEEEEEDGKENAADTKDRAPVEVVVLDDTPQKPTAAGADEPVEPVAEKA